MARTRTREYLILFKLSPKLIIHSLKPKIMQKFALIFALHVICISLLAQSSNSLIDASSMLNYSTAPTDDKDLIKVATLGTIQSNQRFQNNVQIVKASYQKVVNLKAAIAAETDEVKKAELDKQLGVAVTNINKQNKKMVDAYGFSLRRDYVLVIERSHIYMRVTPEEAEELKKQLERAAAKQVKEAK